MRRALVLATALAWAVAAHGQVSPEIRALHESVFTFDAHVDISLSFATEETDPGVDGFEPVDLPKMERGGLDAAAFTVFASHGPLDEAGYAAALDQARVKAAAIRRMALEMYPARIGLALTADDLRIHAAEGRRGASRRPVGCGPGVGGPPERPGHDHRRLDRSPVIRAPFDVGFPLVQDNGKILGTNGRFYGEKIN